VSWYCYFVLSLPVQLIAWKDCSRNDLLCVDRNVKHLLKSLTQLKNLKVIGVAVASRNDYYYVCCCFCCCCFCCCCWWHLRRAVTEYVLPMWRGCSEASRELVMEVAQW